MAKSKGEDHAVPTARASPLGKSLVSHPGAAGVSAPAAGREPPTRDTGGVHPTYE
jgi:hypothetical protein